MTSICFNCRQMSLGNPNEICGYCKSHDPNKEISRLRDTEEVQKAANSLAPPQVKYNKEIFLIKHLPSKKVSYNDYWKCFVEEGGDEYLDRVYHFCTAVISSKRTCPFGMYHRLVKSDNETYVETVVFND